MKEKFRLGKIALLLLSVALAGCAKRVRFDALPLAGPGKATARIELTYDRNNNLQVQLLDVPDPPSLNSQYTRYVLWAATPDRQHVINIGQLRVDEKKKAEIKTLTPLRSFILFVTVEPRGDVMAPGPDIIFQTKEIDW
ncbi:MAG: hypothetical protein HY647_08845 [Acidobacteria bacterium]|nr:hypothetical protein [Acidobacteriota bacterium]